MAAIAAVLTAGAAPLGGGGALDVSLTRIVSALLLCLMLAAFAIVVLKRGGGRIALTGIGRATLSRRIAVIESRRIGAHADLCLLRCDGDEYLILSSATAQQVLRHAPVTDDAT